MENRIREIMSILFEVPIEKLQGSFKQSEIENWDSLRHLNLIIELESEYDVSFEPEEISEMIDFQKVVEHLSLKLGK
jgi:acyl carrier protein